MSSSFLSPDDRARRMTLVLEQVLSRRAAGERLPDEAVMRQWPELMPELAEHLNALGRVEAAAGIHNTPTHVMPEGPPGAQREKLDFAHIALGDALRGYQILGEIHRGGQGVVYEALQTSTGRKVAIKVTREGPFSAASEVQRFEREARILAQIRHPNIVAIHDCGMAAGCFYFIMDRIVGDRLDVFVSNRALDVGSTLRLFAKVCDAVNAAHLLGVIHRDLKPGNILVDERGDPHVLDFGLAKVTVGGSEYAATEIMTVTGQFVGSLPWASPEQAMGYPNGVDTRTDVYSLGVILYQMLTGRFPYEVVGSMREVLENIQNVEAVAPSRITPAINGEVETIVLKCLQKERERRYQTAGELSRDIQRYLAGDAIEAKRDSFVYVLSKQLRRHKLPVTLGIAIFAVSIIGFGVSFTFWRQAAADRDDANFARSREQTQRSIAEKARDAADEARKRAQAQEIVAQQNAEEAHRSATQAKAVNQFLRTILASGDPTELGGKGTIRQALDRADGLIAKGALGDQPEALAAAREALGSVYRDLGLLELAEPHLRAALELKRGYLSENDPQYAYALHELVWLLIELHKPEEAEPLSRQALKIYEETAGPESLSVADELNSLGQIEAGRGDSLKSASFYERSLEIYRASPDDHRKSVATVLNNLGTAYDRIGNTTEAERCQREALKLRREVLPPDHLDIAQSLHNLATVIEDRGQVAEAIELLKEAQRIREKGYGSEHPDLALTHGALGSILMEEGRFDEAEAHLKEALREQRVLLAPDHASIGITLNKLARLKSARGDHRGAIVDMTESIDIVRKAMGPDHADLATSINDLAALYFFLADYDQASRYFNDALTIYRKYGDTERPNIASALGNLGAVQVQLSNYIAAEAYYREAMQLTIEASGHEHLNTARYMALAGEAIRLRGDDAGAAPLFAESLAIRRRLLPAGHRDLASCAGYLGLALQGMDCPEEAEPLLREALEIWANAGVETWHVNRARSALGAALLAQGRVASARDVLWDVYERLTNDPDLSAALFDITLNRLRDAYGVEDGETAAAATP